MIKMIFILGQVKLRLALPHRVRKIILTEPLRVRAIKSETKPFPLLSIILDPGKVRYQQHFIEKDN